MPYIVVFMCVCVCVRTRMYMHGLVELPAYSYGLYSYGLHSYGLCGYGLCSCGLYSCGHVYMHGLVELASSKEMKQVRAVGFSKVIEFGPQEPLDHRPVRHLVQRSIRTSDPSIRSEHSIRTFDPSVRSMGRSTEHSV